MDLQDNHRESGTRDAGQRIVKAASVITLASFLGYGVSFLKASLVAARLGAGWQMDVFLTAFAIVSLFASFANGPINAVLVPVYLSLKAENIEEAKLFFYSVSSLLLFAFALLSVLLAIGTPALVRLFGMNLEYEGRLLATRLIWCMLPIVLFSGLWAASQAVMNAEKSFFLPAISSSIPALLVIYCLILVGQKWAVYAQAIGLSIGAILQFTLLQISMRLNGFHWRWALFKKTKGITDFLRLLWPLLVTQVLILCLPILDRSMAARYSTGAISALGYAQTLTSMSATVFLTALTTAILPFLSAQMANHDRIAFRNTFFPSIRLLMVFLTPLSLTLIVLRMPVIRLVFERGAFDMQATALTVPAYSAYMIGILPMAITFLCSRGFNALKDSRTNAVVGTIFFVTVKVGMNFLLSRALGYTGLALATSVAYFTTAIVMLEIMVRRLGGGYGTGLSIVGFKTLFASLVTGGMAWWGSTIGSNNPLLQISLGFTLAIFGYFVMGYLLRLDEIQMVKVAFFIPLWSRGRTILLGMIRQ